MWDVQYSARYSAALERHVRVGGRVHRLDLAAVPRRGGAVARHLRRARRGERGGRALLGGVGGDARARA